MRRLFTGLLLVAAVLAAQAQEAVEAVVVKVDKPAGRITLKHAAIPAFDMPAMTGAYKVQDPALLDNLQSGESVQFSLARVHNQYTVTRIAPRR